MMRKMLAVLVPSAKVTMVCGVFVLSVLISSLSQLSDAQSSSFPGVSRDLAPFCAARPSLPIDLASMIVHVKKDTSFNYKLYLFSADHVFQTGQVIPRDDFRVHAFPVKLKKLNEFWPADVPTYTQTGSGVVGVNGSRFDLKSFFAYVPLKPTYSPAGRRTSKLKQSARRRNQKQQPKSRVLRMHISDAATDDGDEPLPGDPEFARHDVANAGDDLDVSGPDRSHHSNGAHDFSPNRYIQFDRDDLVSPSDRRADLVGEQEPSSRQQVSPRANRNGSPHELGSETLSSQSGVLPVGSFTSFHVNLTYLVRKDFDQLDPTLVRIKVDANRFQVTEVSLISDGSASASGPQSDSSKIRRSELEGVSKSEDYDFLSHKIIRDPNTRITAINQIYEEWITRNFYTVVYIQRRLDSELDSNLDDETLTDASSSTLTPIISERLVFRGSSLALVGADQLDYNVKAAAFITEKNGLHYFLEFTPANKFYLSAIDWANRPFRIIDSQRFPIKATKTQFDNEELLLCPPAVCFSRQPVDEIVSYGRLPFSREIQETISLLLNPTDPRPKQQVDTPLESTQREPRNFDPVVELVQNATTALPAEYLPLPSLLSSLEESQLINDTNSLTSLSSISNMITELGANWLETKLHLRDWVWSLSRATLSSSSSSSSSSSPTPKSGGLLRERPKSDTNESKKIFSWKYELAKRNDVKLSADKYGYVLSGHDIDASFRIYNELYIITENHLITINYSAPNETVTSSRPLAEEFQGLASTLVDPITGAFYDRHTNQIYFFKGDRFIGYDYASKLPLDDFVVDTVVDEQHVPATRSALASTTTTPTVKLSLGNSAARAPKAPQRMVVSLPVIDILGRQVHVDAVYHDFLTDTIYVFSGMKFFTFRADEFKNGAVKYSSSSRNAARMHCINEHFFDGCHFDEAFRNPCKGVDSKESSAGIQVPASKSKLQSGLARIVDLNEPTEELRPAVGEGGAPRRNFSQEQQMKLRAIATGNRLIDAVVGSERTIGRVPLSPIDSFGDQTNTKHFAKPIENSETLIIYLLITMIVVTLVATTVIVVVAITCTKPKPTSDSELQTRNDKSAEPIASVGVVATDAMRQLSPERTQSSHRGRKHRHESPQVSSYSSGANSPPTRVVITKGYSPNSVLSKYDITDSSAL